jgi:ppGpp synthetase/RelA/SpoT-type nucleotidyltranferase
VERAAVDMAKPAAKFEFDLEQFKRDYASKRKANDALLSEVIYILDAKITDSKIKIHGIEGRVKDELSIIRKCQEKEIIRPFEELTNIVGARVICLFRSDLKKLGDLIENSFQLVPYSQ